jgi:hypothetical protein
LVFCCREWADKPDLRSQNNTTRLGWEAGRAVPGFRSVRGGGGTGVLMLSDPPGEDGCTQPNAAALFRAHQRCQRVPRPCSLSGASVRRGGKRLIASGCVAGRGRPRSLNQHVSAVRGVACRHLASMRGIGSLKSAGRAGSSMIPRPAFEPLSLSFPTAREKPLTHLQTGCLDPSHPAAS